MKPTPPQARLDWLDAFRGLAALWVVLTHAGWFARIPAACRHAFVSKPASFLVSLAARVLLLPLAWLFWKFTEDPSQRLARSLARRLQGKTP